MSPFKSERQRKYMYIHHPRIAERWSREEKEKKHRASRKRKQKSGG